MFFYVEASFIHLRDCCSFAVGELLQTRDSHGRIFKRRLTQSSRSGVSQARPKGQQPEVPDPSLTLEKVMMVSSRLASKLQSCEQRTFSVLDSKNETRTFLAAPLISSRMAKRSHTTILVIIVDTITIPPTP